MSQLQQVDNAMRAALGQGVKVISDYYDIYRLNDVSTGQIICPQNKVLTNFQARIAFAVPKPLVEASPLSPMIYAGMMDTRKLVTGDILVQVGPKIPNNLDGRVFLFSDVRPLEAPVFFRVEFMSYFSRPHSITIGDEPLLGDGGYIGTTKSQEAVYTLNLGLYSVSNEPGTIPATIPCSLVQHRRVGEKQAITYPTASPRGTYYGMCPILPGVTVQPGDVISDATGNRFSILNVFTFEVGLVGVQFICESLFV